MPNKRFLIYMCLIFISLFLITLDIIAATWRIETIDSPGNVGMYTSIAVDSKDNVHISYNDETNDDLKYATNTTGHGQRKRWIVSGMWDGIPPWR